MIYQNATKQPLFLNYFCVIHLSDPTRRSRVWKREPKSTCLLPLWRLATNWGKHLLRWIIEYRVFFQQPSLPPLFSTKRDYFCIFYEIPNVREHLIRQYFCTEWGMGGRIYWISTYFDITPSSAVAPLELPQESADRREKGFSLSRGGSYLLKSSFDCALSSLQHENQFF